MLRHPLVTAAWLVAASSAVADSKPIDVSVQQLVAAPQQFNGKRVSVSGYFDTTETHACDLRATKKRPNDNRQLINIEIPPGSEDMLKRLTHDFTKVVRARIIGTFQYRYVGPFKETPVHGDPLVQKIVTMQTGFGWEGLCDKQITKISDFRVFAR
jgi:hypothetical protein